MTDEKKEQKVKEEEAPPFKFDNKMASKPIIAPDGHPVLTQEDIDARQ